MARKQFASSGTLVVVEHESRILADNPLGDPHIRKLAAHFKVPVWSVQIVIGHGSPRKVVRVDQ